MVLERYNHNEVSTLADLRECPSDEPDEEEERGAAMFSFPSCVGFLRQSLPDRVQHALDEDMFVLERDLWNLIAGSIFRCDVLVSTQCSEISRVCCFSCRVVS